VEEASWIDLASAD
jgi:hypothetical protein